MQFSKLFHVSISHHEIAMGTPEAVITAGQPL